LLNQSFGCALAAPRGFHQTPAADAGAVQSGIGCPGGSVFFYVRCHPMRVFAAAVLEFVLVVLAVEVVDHPENNQDKPGQENGGCDGHGFSKSEGL
jgi:hypothetical protein